ncbi:metallophosphoesterase [Flavobacteriaceae bacterium TP-CH-4]|uniref:Metallophosphoesterase n=1 Tax=Pelagihabitans pacificus TaxID=2696054 RepID=A0A967E6K3_9FLAO|nr:metallophosphoesterase [Pelagihabitans pacificus]NHF59700.1 metallophosphoesterase [Pelagihabitans pacificus]
MRRYSFFSILLLALAVLLVDIIAFYWLQSITKLLTSDSLKLAINVAFWFFTVGLVGAILLLKIRFDSIPPRRQQLLVSSLYGLTVSSFVPKLIFILIIPILRFSNYAFSEQESLIVVPIVGLLSGFLPFFVIVYAIFMARYRFKVRHLKLKFSNLPNSFDGLRIVQISDTHLGSFNHKYHVFDRAVKLINHLEPDFIFFTGDLVNNFQWEVRGWKSTFDKLSAKKGKYSVLGNHDYGDYSEWETPKAKQDNFEGIKKFHADIGFKLLLNEAKVVALNGESIAVVGVENWGHPPFKQYGDLQKALETVNDIPFKILLSHDPSHWSGEVVKETDIALTLSGHTHGMQAGIHLKNSQWSPIKYKYEHWAGLYSQGNQYLYVNRGLGWLGFPGRLGMRPEITCIDFK